MTTTPPTNTLDAVALEAAMNAANHVWPMLREHNRLITSAAIRAYISALPAPATGGEAGARGVLRKIAAGGKCYHCDCPAMASEYLTAYSAALERDEAEAKKHRPAPAALDAGRVAESVATMVHEWYSTQLAQRPMSMPHIPAELIARRIAEIRGGKP